MLYYPGLTDLHAYSAYMKGELVLVANEMLKNQHGQKGAMHWFGPYAVVQQRPSGAFVLQELDGAVLKQPIAWRCLKSYVPRKGLKPVVLDPKWVTDIKETEEFSADMNAASLKRPPGTSPSWVSRLHQPWELKGKELVEYWEGVRDCWNKRKLAGSKDQAEDMIQVWDEELRISAEEEAMFWNFRFDVREDSEGDISRWKNDDDRY